jgi:serine protease Do
MRPISHPRVRAGACAAFASVVAAASAAAFSPPEIYRQAAPGVVFVFAAHRANADGSTGTGSVVSADGLVLTSRHVLVDDVRGRPFPIIQVYFRPEAPTGDPGRDLRDPHRARIVAVSDELDLALLRVEDPPGGLVALPFGDSARMSIGEPVAAIGHPTGGGLWTLTTGTISGIKLQGARDVFQTEAALNPGNSGGPLLDTGARLIGVNTSVLRSAADGTPLIGLNFSVKSNAVRAWLDGQGVEVASAWEPTRWAARVPPPAREEPVPTPPAPEPDAEDEVRPRAQLPPQDLAPGARPPAPPAPAPPPPRKAPREFRGPRGETMYGVPDLDFDLDRVEADLYARSRRNAERAQDELDAADARD